MDLLLAGLILGFCGALPCPMKVACGAVRRSRGWGGGGCLRRAGLNCVFINRPIKKYPPHSPIQPS